MKRTFAYRLIKEKHPLTAMATEKRNGLVLPLGIMVFIVVFLAINFLVNLPLNILSYATSKEYVRTLMSGNLGQFVMMGMNIVVMALLTLYCVKFEKRSPRSMGFSSGNVIPEYLKGVLLGFIAFSAVLLTGVLLKGFHFENVSNPIAFSSIFVWLLTFLISGMQEEVICRGFLMISISRRAPMWIAVLMNSVLFGLLHFMNPGINLLPVINLTLFGIFSSLLFLRTSNIWCVGAFHAIWNFVQGNFFGLQVSGAPELPTLLHFSQTGNTLVNGGAFGPEGGLPVTFVLIVGIVLILFLPEKTRDVLATDSLESI